MNSKTSYCFPAVFNNCCIAEDMIVDLRFYEINGERSKMFYLDRFPIFGQIKQYPQSRLLGPHALWRRAKRKILEPNSLRFAQKGLGYDPTFRHVVNRSVVTGLFQSPRYFESDELALRAQLDTHPHLALLIGGIPITEFVAVHVRRGDYLTHPGFELPNPLGYYARALTRVRDLGRPILVFSDDPHWVKSQSIFNNAYIFDSVVTDHDPVLELMAMSHCNSIIISNSTFSWWAAWFAQRRAASIFAPALWIHGIKADDIQIYPLDWIRIEWEV